MPPRSAFLLLLLCAFCLLCPPDLHASGPTGPRFTWAAFQRFWEKQATPLVFIHNAEAVEGGYLVNYGHGVTLRAFTPDQSVTGVEIRLTSDRGSEGGGPQFKRLMYHALSVGSFRWPDDKIDEARRYFAILGTETKEFHYQMTRFRYTYDAATGWTFGFDYVPAASAVP